MTSTREVVITGMGLVSPIGIGRDAFLQSLLAGTSGIQTITQYDTSQLNVHIGGELVDFQPKLYVKPRKSMKVMSREIQMGVASATLAVEDAALDVSGLDVDRFGVVYGSPMLYADVHELYDLYVNCAPEGIFDFDRFGAQFPTQMFPLWMLKYLPNMTASHIGIAHGAHGPNNSIVLGDVSSLAAMVEATTVIQRGLADVMLAGGSGSRLDLTNVMYRGDSNLSKRNDDPAAASRPFDNDRDGMVNSEGAATILLESREHAEARGANVLGSVAGYALTHRGTANTAEELVVASQHAYENALQICLKRADLSKPAISHVNAHGASTVPDDIAEARAIQAVLGDIPVSAPKSYLGNMGAGGSVAELCASLTFATTGAIPRTLNYDSPDERCPVNVVTENATHERGTHCICLGQAGMGQTVAVAIRC